MITRCTATFSFPGAGDIYREMRCTRDASVRPHAHTAKVTVGSRTIEVRWRETTEGKEKTP